LELPFKKSPHQTSTNPENNLWTLKASSNLMIFTKELKGKENEKLDLDIMVSQRLFDPNDRFV
jgi:hypothetical protein